MDIGNDSHSLLIENMSDAFAYHQIVTDSKGNPVDYIILNVNPAFEEMTNLPRNEVIGKRFTEVYPDIKEFSYDWIGSFGKVALMGETVRFEQLFEPTGRCYKITAYSDEPGFFAVLFRDAAPHKKEREAQSAGVINDKSGKPLFISGFVTDITDRKQVEEALKKAKEDYQTIVNLTGDIIVQVDKEGRWTFLNDLACAFWGETREKLLGRLFSYYLHPDDQEETSASVQKIVRFGGTEMGLVNRQRTPQGWRFVQWNAAPLYQGREYMGFQATGRDITELKQAEEALRNSEEYNRSIVEVLPDMILRLTKNGDHLDVITSSPVVITSSPEELYLSKEELIGKNIRDVLPEDISVRAIECITRTLETNSRQGFEYELPVLDSKLWFEARMISSGQDEVITLIRNITKRKQMEEALNYQFQFEKLISEISSAFLSLPSEKLDEGINYALDLAGNFFKVDRSYVFQFSEDGQNISKTHEWCAEGTEPQMDKIQNQPLESLSWLVERVRNCCYVHIPDVSKLPAEANAERKEFQRQGIQSLLSVPLRSKDRFIGFFGFDSVKTKKTWTEETISFLQIIADILINTFERSRTEQKIRYISFHDTLTGLYNRAYLEEEIQRLDTDRQLPISIILADLNGLKLVNDTYGHTKGDEMLISAADILRESCREEDIIARWGGDEFLILLTQTNTKEARALCERIKAGCKDVYVQKVPVSIALGFSCKENIEKDLSEVLREAENYMYRQKLTESHSVKSAVLKALLITLEEKGYETKTHIQNMQKISEQIAKKLALPESELDRLHLLINLHDIGKITISESILNKKGPLTSHEWEVMRKHPETGYRIASSSQEFAHVAEDILAHHERWDGSGYPRGLKGKAIPLLARILAVADAYEIMSYGSFYKKALTPSEAVAELIRCAGTQFDPKLVEIFLSIKDKVVWN